MRIPIEDLKFALRTLFKTPIVTFCAVVSIALGIGANTAIFSLFDEVLLRKLPVQEPERLVILSTPGPHLGTAGFDIMGMDDEVFSYPMFRDLEKVQTVFTGIAAHSRFEANLAVGGVTVKGIGLLVSGSYFQILHIRPALGRMLSPQDDIVLGEPHVAVISHSYWESHFGKDPGVLNRTITINGQVLTIVGVAQDGFDGITVGLNPQAFVPITMKELITPGSIVFQKREYDWAYLFARLKPGITPEQACAALNIPYRAIVKEIEAPLLKDKSEQMMKQFKTKLLVLKPGARGQSMVRDIARSSVIIMLFLTGLVLLIACVNVANLLLARGAARTGEMAIRLSIGASRARIVSQLLVESCLLALFAGAAGIIVAHLTLDLLASIAPSDVATLQFAISRSALLFTVILTFATGLFFGLFPALHCTRLDLALMLKGQNQASGAKSTVRFRKILTVAQLAISFALLATAGLFIKGLRNTGYEELGMKVDNVIVFGVSPMMNGYSLQQSLQFYNRVEDELAAIPGANSVTGSLMRLFNYYNCFSNISMEGYDNSSAPQLFSHSSEGQKKGPGAHYFTRFNYISPDFFRTFEIPLIAGRDFTRSDVLGSPGVAIVNEAFARRFKLGRDIIGKRMGFEGNPLNIRIVGLVRNSKYWTVKIEDEPLFYLPYKQALLDHLTFYVRTSSNPKLLYPAVKKVMARLDPNLPVETLCTMSEQVHKNTFVDRMIGILSTAFACLSLMLAAVGLYGILAYTVVQRTREIGLRIALGATQAQVRAIVFRQVGMMTMSGGAIGLALALALGRIVESRLYYINGSDPVVLCISAGLLGAITLAAGFFPASRAARLNPMQALRCE
jgi:predicted permease